VQAEAIPWHRQPYSAQIVLPPLGVIWLAIEGESAAPGA
jgi:hypothetical protein